MRKKTLMVITLIAVMLFSSFLPLVEVQATTSTVMTFNTDLYKGLKAYFQETGINAKYNDIERSIQMDAEVINSIEVISLKEKGISNISGIEFFPNVKSLILSSNNISEESNLGVLNNLPNLNYLDLSSNNITDVSEIEPLISRLLSVDSNAINLSSQVASKIIDVEVNINEQKVTESFTLPKILEMAGIVDNGTIQNKGRIKSEWITSYGQKGNGAALVPHVIKNSIPNPVTADNNSFDIEIGYENITSYTPYEGLVKLVINIKDKNTNSYNTNPASKNILKDSMFTLYYVVHLEDTNGIILKDANLYNAVKEQLIKEQEINPELLSYKYITTKDGEIDYDICDYTLNGSTATLKINGKDAYTISNFNAEGGVGNIYSKTNAKYYYNVPYEMIDMSTADENGNVTTKRKVKVPNVNLDCRYLYVDAYDEPQVLVITDLDLINKITSLKLNDKRISDLSGLEGFVGLESDLNVSYNYIDTLADIYALQINKENVNVSLQEVFNEKKEAMASSKGKIVSAYEKIENIIKSIKEQIAIIEANKKIMASITVPKEGEIPAEYTNAEKAIQGAVNAIYGAGDEDKGLVGEIEKALNDPQEGLNTNLSAIYSRLAAMYTVFNKEYKLTTILTPELNYQTEEEYEAYNEKNKTLEGAKELAKAQISRIATLESADALSELEKNLIKLAFGLSLSEDKDNPISVALNDMVEAYEETNARRTDWVAINSKFIAIGIYSQATNYCLLERMNNETKEDVCYIEEYLENLIEEYTYEGIDCTMIKAIYEYLKNGTASSAYPKELNRIFVNYINKVLHTSTGATVIRQLAEACKGPYYPIDSIGFEVLEKDGYPQDVSVFEVIDEQVNNDGIFFFEQLMSLANKFTAIDEVSLYVKLPALKRIDVRNNEIESLGDTQVTMLSKDGTKTTTTENLASLKNLKELYAGHNFVTGDIACVDWSTLTTLKSLDLSYNFISDILPLEVLKNLRYLDVSDNLLSGEFNLSVRKMEKLQDLILSGNQYTDISKLLADYEMLAEGDFTKYFAREDTLNLDLSRQSLEINIEEPIKYDSSNNVREVELPPIFAQLEHIDSTRTAYGTTSSKGSIQARGGVAYIPVNKAGDYTASVKVIAANGYPEEVTTSIGINTECTINYSVKDYSVKSVTINENITTVEKGTTQNYTATVNGTNIENKDVKWSVTGNASANTTIDNNGVLTVSADETAEKITITATSVVDSTKSASLEISVIEKVQKTVTKVTVTEDKTVAPGTELTFTADVVGENLTAEDKKVVWSILGNNSPYTRINEETGVLTIGSDETSEGITVVATSKLDNTKIGTAVVRVIVIKEVEVISNKSKVVPGTTVQMKAEVKGSNLTDADKVVTWTVAGGTSSETKISEDGVLTVAANETATSLKVTATSVRNAEISGSKDIKISVNEPEYGYEISGSETEVVGISPETSSKDFKTKFIKDSNYTAEVKRNGKAISDDTKVATSDLVVVSKNGTVVETYELVVKGDVNGDGVANALDSSLIKAYRAKLTNLSGVFLDAADINNDGDVSVMDVRLLLYHRARIEGYIL